LIDSRVRDIRHVNYNYGFRPYPTKEAWLAKKEALRMQILVAAGLHPRPKRCPLKTKFVGRIKREDYTVEQVYFESFPGFYVSGDLYRPKGKALGRTRPGIANPHGHTLRGRLHDDETYSAAARCIGFARMGFVAFTYDMLGFCDSWQVSHRFGTPQDELRGLSNLGLQLWNGMRVLDFLESLPDVDPERLACTGESGGGTQTFLLSAVDERVSVSAPVNMISHTMQGGCRCENCGLLRLDTFNVEIGAMMAPRPMMMISATGDWTKDTPTMEFPATRSIYRLLGAEDNVRFVRIDAPHNYNKQSREAVYGFFAKHLLGRKSSAPVPEKPYTKEPDVALLVWYLRAKPKEAVTQDELLARLAKESERQLGELKPRTKAALGRFRKVYGAGLKAALAAELPAGSDVKVYKRARKTFPACSVEQVVIGRKGKGDKVSGTLVLPAEAAQALSATLLVHPKGRAALVDARARKVKPIVRRLLDAGQVVLAIDAFNTGEASAKRRLDYNYWTCYNRTDAANRVQDILTALAFLGGREGIATVNLVGLGDAGTWCLPARALAPDVRATVIDAARLDTSSDDELVEKLFIPSLRREGDVRTAMALSAPGRLFIHNTGDAFAADWAEAAYRSAGASDKFIVKRVKADDEAIVRFLTR
jgi:dienelactone hydrolase